MAEKRGRTEKEWMAHCQGLRKKHGILTRRFDERARQGKMGVISEGGKGNIPVLFARGKGLAESWENAMIALWNKGGFVRTQYDDRDKDTGLYIVGPSMDSTMTWVIEQPFAEPRIHRDFPGGLNDLEEYRQEVVDGIKDHWVRDPNNPEDKRWEYTYHGRIKVFEVPGLEKVIDQFDIMTKAIAKSPITRRAQVITWQPWNDLNIGDPACFQSMWGRILRQHPGVGFEFYSDETTGKPKLNLNVRFRSWDGYGASNMNMYAFTELGGIMARGISEIRGEETELGRVACIGDSFHIYYKDFETFLGRFVPSLHKRHFAPREDYDTKARTWNSNSPAVQASFEEARKLIPAKIAAQDEKYALGQDLTKDSTKIFKDESGEEVH